MDAFPVEPAPPHASERTRPSPARQVLGFFLGLVGGGLLGAAALALIVFAPGSSKSSSVSFVAVVLCFVQFLWLIPLAFLGWRRRNIGFLVGVLLASVPLILLDALCFGPMYWFERH